MFGFTQTTGGLYFATPSETDTAAQLKKATAQALGRPVAQQTLATAPAWFKDHASNFG